MARAWRGLWDLFGLGRGAGIPCSPTEKDREGQRRAGNSREGQRRAGKGREGQGRAGKGRDGQGWAENGRGKGEFAELRLQPVLQPAGRRGRNDAARAWPAPVAFVLSIRACDPRPARVRFRFPHQRGGGLRGPSCGGRSRMSGMFAARAGAAQGLGRSTAGACSFQPGRVRRIRHRFCQPRRIGVFIRSPAGRYGWIGGCVDGVGRALCAGGRGAEWHMSVHVSVRPSSQPATQPATKAAKAASMRPSIHPSPSVRQG
eukprot:gene24036-biopygen8910